MDLYMNSFSYNRQRCDGCPPSIAMSRGNGRMMPCICVLLCQGVPFVWRVALEAADSAVAESAIDVLVRLHYRSGSSAQSKYDVEAVLR